MADSLFPSIEYSGDESLESRWKKRRISETADADIEVAQRINEESLKRWRRNRVQQIYACRLVESLRRVRQRPNEDGNISSVAREIRETADRVLAASAQGRNRWSRVILASRERAKMKKHRKAKSTGKCVLRKSRETKQISLQAVDKKMKILGRLVPGCRKLSVPNLIDEATDYIAALQMQVRAMEALAELLATAAPRTTTLTIP